MRVVVTGGAGFLGSHVADHLRESAHEVLIFDRVASHHSTVTGDLLNVEELAAACVGADAICHLGAVGDVYVAAEQPALAAAVNVVGTANVCEAAIRTKVRRVVIASTWEVYGRPRYEPIDELHPCDPDHPYNITKLAGERIGLSYAHLKSLDLVALRLGTAYGTRMRPNSVFSIFIRRAMAGEPITIQGSGEQGRQFTHARDIARAFEAALTRGQCGDVFNIVAPEMISIRELAERVAAEIPTTVVYGPARPADVPSALVASARAERELGWSAQTPFAGGLLELMNEARAIARG